MAAAYFFLFCFTSAFHTCRPIVRPDVDARCTWVPGSAQGHADGVSAVLGRDDSAERRAVFLSRECAACNFSRSNQAPDSFHAGAITIPVSEQMWRPDFGTCRPNGLSLSSLQIRAPPSLAC